MKKVQDYKFYSIICMLSITFIIIAMSLTYRISELGNFLIPGGLFIFVMSYSIADIVAEVYGFRLAKQMIYGNVLCIMIYNFCTSILIKLPVPADASYKNAYDIVYGHGFRLGLGFYISFLVSDYVNSFFMSKWKVKLEGKSVWIRSVGSSIIGETMFSILATSIMYINIMSNGMVLKQIITTWVIKIILAIVAAYPVVFISNLLKKKEGVDVYDYDIKFSPFKFNLSKDSND